MNDTFSPSVMHQKLLRNAPLRLAYREGLKAVAWRARARERIWKLLAVSNDARVPLNVRAVWSRETALGRIKKIIFTSEPGADVPAYWCTPRNVSPPYTTFICLQGHSTGMHNSIALSQDEKTTIDVPGDRDFAIGCLKRGIAALCIEQRSLGERRERSQKQICQDNTCHDAAWRSVMAGRTLLGERVFDVDRALDYLYWRGDVEMKRVGLMGNSGGGTVTTYAAAVLSRISFAMPSCTIASFADCIGSIHHCGCNYVPGILQWMDMGDILAACAPKPLVVVAGRQDEIFPFASARKQFDRARALYRELGADDRCRFVAGPEGHRFYADLAWAQMLKLISLSTQQKRILDKVCGRGGAK